MLQDTDVDAVIVASPDEYHCEHTVLAARAGKHVLCEKPMCRSLDEADRMMTEAGKNDVILMVGFLERYSHPCAEAKRRIDSGEIGTPRMVLARRCHPSSVVRGREWLNDDRTGGVLNYAGTHNIDLICWFMGSAPERVYGEMGQLILKGQDFTDCAVMTFRFPNGSVAALYETFAYPGSYPHGVDRSVEVLGDEGVLHVDFMAQPVRAVTGSGYEVVDSVTWPMGEKGIEGALLAEVEHFVDCVKRGKIPLTTGEDGKLAIKIAIAAREAAETGKAVRV
jgi:predicted dehydrogenase